MKIVSVVVFTLALIGSWALVHAKKPVAESVHAGIQSDLRNIITEYVQQNVPESQNIRFEKLWTEALSKDRVEAKFAEESAEMVVWNLDELRILGNTVNFTEPIQITAGSGELEGGEQ